VTDPDQLKKVANGIALIELDGKGYLTRKPGVINLDRIKDGMDGQERAMRAFAAEHDIDFIDLTPNFQAEAKRGIGLYNYSDTHWNDAGNVLAANVLAEYLIGLK
jgi:hypothetical protein